MTMTKNGSAKVGGNFKAVCAKVQELLVSAERNDVTSRYKVAILIKDAMTSAEYGQEAVPKLAKTIRYDKGSLYRMARVAKAWSNSEFDKLSKRLNKADLPLTWSHFEVLASIKDGKMRSDMVERAFDEALTILELTAATKTAKPRRQTVFNEAEPIASSDLRALSNRLAEWVNDVSTEVDTWGGRLLGEAGVAKLQLGESVGAKLSETAERLARTAKSMQDVAARLKILLASVQTHQEQIPEQTPGFVPVHAISN